MKTISCLIADDEAPALELLELYIEKINYLKIVARCRDAYQVYNSLREKTVDLMFLDIEMPQLTGIDLIRSLPKTPKVIFTTAYKDYAVDAFELHALDYLLKPFSFERFLSAIERYNESTAAPPESLPTHLTIFVNRQRIPVPLAEILYIQSLGNYVKVITEKKTFITYTSIKSILEKLHSAQFQQIHKSYIVSLSKIDSFNSMEVDIRGTKIPIGRNFKNISNSL